MPALVITSLGSPAELGSYLFATATVSLGYTGMAVAAVRLVQAVSAHAPLTALSRWGIFGVLCAGARSIAIVHVARAEARIAGRVGSRLRQAAAEALLRAGPKLGGDDGAGEGARCVAVAVRGAERAAIAGVLASFRAKLSLAPLAALLLYLLPLVGLIWICVLVPFGWLLARARERVRATERAALGRSADVEAHLDDLFLHLDLFRVHGTRSALLETMARLAERSADANASAAGTRALSSAANELLAALAVTVLAVLAGTGALHVDAWRLAPAIAVAFLLYRPLRDAGDARAALAAGQVALEAMSELLEPTTPATALVDRRDEGGDLQLLAFGAERGGPRWTFSVAAGHAALVTGPVGSGKTTLLRALLGLLPSSGEGHFGRASFGGLPVHGRPFAWVPQDAPVVAGDLRHNLSLGGDGVDEAEALLRELAPSLEGTLHRGGTLSGGERAMLAIARAVASRRAVVLLDEPTAHLDPEAEARVVALLDSLRGRRTLVIVTHRPQAFPKGYQRVVAVLAGQKEKTASS